MLLLVRKEGEKTYIGTDITITVKSIRGNRVTLGFDAPRSISIERDDCVKKKGDIAHVLKEPVVNVE